MNTQHVQESRTHTSTSSLAIINAKRSALGLKRRSLYSVSHFKFSPLQEPCGNPSNHDSGCIRLVLHSLPDGSTLHLRLQGPLSYLVESLDMSQPQPVLQVLRGLTASSIEDCLLSRSNHRVHWWKHPVAVSSEIEQ